MTPEQIAELRQKRYNGTVVHLRKVHSDLMVMRVRPDFPRPAPCPTSRPRRPALIRDGGASRRVDSEIYVTESVAAG